MAGRFIVIEGLDGSGISTQTRRLASALDARNEPYYCTREPSDGPIGSQIRLALTGRVAFAPETLALLFAADRLDHVQHAIKPRLEAGVHVLCERHVLSSLAYQGSELADVEWVATINRPATRAIAPDLTLFLDVPPEVSLQRIDAGRHTRELFEHEAGLERTRQAFGRAIDRVRSAGGRVDILDAARAIGDVADDILTRVLEIIGRD